MLSPALQTYSGAADRYDELLDAGGVVRPHWRVLLERLQADWPDSARRGVELARRLVVENGVTYNVYADPQGKDRPWALDPLPVILTAAEWREIELGVQQRATALNALLQDLYGPQRLLAEGIVPAELPFGHPNYLWPCRGLQPPEGRWLHLYAVDLARAPDGRWWVLADRSQTPSGAGYALENREIVTRIFPEVLHELGVRPVARFFGALREQMLSFAEDEEASLAVVLTPGPFNETYFEHAYLARQLGLPLVEGSDLTVRNHTVYLKTLSGLRRVHSILRRLDDDFCDPVELRGDSALGVPGLLGAARAGRVQVANALGCGVLESAAWLGFLPGAAEWLIGETLRLPTVATWWCGERPALDYVLGNLQGLVLKSAFPNQRFDAIFGRDLDDSARADILARIKRRPHAYVAQERFALSQVPAWRSTGQLALTAKAVTLRVYAVATQTGYRVMPGGLARIASESAVDVVSSQSGGGSKDVWVLSEGRAAHDTTARAAGLRASVRNDELPSRLGENLFWLGRYAERCEDKARLLRATLEARADSELWEYALAVTRDLGVIARNDNPLKNLFDAGNTLGLAADVKRFTWCAQQARSRLSTEHWRAIGVLDRQMQEITPKRSEAREILDRLLLSFAALGGFAFDDMVQDNGWRLMMCGRRLERVQFLSNLLARCLRAEHPSTQSELEWLLNITSSTMAYRSRYMASPRLSLTLELIVRDTGNPHALAFQRAELQAELERLSASVGSSLEDMLTDCYLPLVDIDMGSLEGEGQGAAYMRQTFAQGLETLAAAAGRLSDRLSLRHFSHVQDKVQTVAT